MAVDPARSVSILVATQISRSHLSDEPTLAGVSSELPVSLQGVHPTSTRRAKSASSSWGRLARVPWVAHLQVQWVLVAVGASLMSSWA